MTDTVATPRGPLRRRTRTTAAVQNTGYAIGVGTLLFLMYLVLRTQGIDCDRRFLVVAILALGIAMAFSFIGGSAKAEGKLPLPEKWSPVTFAVSGGIAAFLIVLLAGWQMYKCDPAAPPVDPVVTTTDTATTAATDTSAETLSLSLPEGATLQQAFQAFEIATKTKVVTRNCSAELLGEVVGPATIDAPSPKAWLEKVRLRITQTVRYDVVEVEKIRYEITCR